MTRTHGEESHEEQKERYYGRSFVQDLAEVTKKLNKKLNEQADSMTPQEQYEICKERGHEREPVSELNNILDYFVCKYCTVCFWTETVQKEEKPWDVKD